MRSIEQLVSKYENLKNKTRKYAANLKAYKKTGGGSTKDERDPVLDAVIEIINKKTIFGELNDFDDDCSCSPSKLLYDKSARPRPSIIETEIITSDKAVQQEEEASLETENEISFPLSPTSPLLDQIYVVDSEAMASNSTAVANDSSAKLTSNSNTVNSNPTTSSSSAAIQKKMFINRPKRRRLQEKSTDLEMLAESKSNYYKQKARFFELECKLKEKDIEYREIQIKLLEEELKQKTQNTKLL